MRGRWFCGLRGLVLVLCSTWRGLGLRVVGVQFCSSIHSCPASRLLARCRKYSIFSALRNIKPMPLYLTCCLLDPMWNGDFAQASMACLQALMP